MHSEQEINLVIQELGDNGDGFALLGGDKVFIPFTAPGDQIRASIAPLPTKMASGRISQILQPGPDRVQPPCKYFTKCGGCSLQHLSRAAEHSWKKKLVTTALRRYGFLDTKVSDVISIAESSRRRTSFTVLKSGKQIYIGYVARHSNYVIPIKSCETLDPNLSELIRPLSLLVQALPAPKKALSIGLTKTSTGIDVVIGSSAQLNLAQREKLSDFAFQHDLARLSWGEKDPEPIVILRSPQVVLGGIAVEIPQYSFLQASLEAEAILIDSVLNHIGSFSKVADLYSGIGTFALPLSTSGAQVIAYDDNEPTIKALNTAVNSAAGRINLTAKRRNLVNYPVTSEELKNIGGVVLDPPRAGAKSQCIALSSSSVDRISYVSCNPKTFARDSRYLADGGFTLVSVVPINQFPWSSHIELVGFFER